MYIRIVPLYQVTVKHSPKSIPFNKYILYGTASPHMNRQTLNCFKSICNHWVLVSNYKNCFFVFILSIEAQNSPKSRTRSTIVLLRVVRSYVCKVHRLNCEWAMMIEHVYRISADVYIHKHNIMMKANKHSYNGKATVATTAAATTMAASEWQQSNKSVCVRSGKWQIEFKRVCGVVWSGLGSEEQRILFTLWTVWRYVCVDVSKHYIRTTH